MCEVRLLISVQSGKKDFSARKDFENDLSLRQQWENNYIPLSLSFSSPRPFPFPSLPVLLVLSPPAPISLLQSSLSFLLSFNLSFSTFKENNIQTKIESLVMMEKFCRHKSMQVLLFLLTYLSSKNQSFTKNFFIFSCLGNIGTSNWKRYDVKEPGICNSLISYFLFIYFFLISLLPAYTIWIGFQMESLIEGSTHVSGSFQTDGISIFPK